MKNQNEHRFSQYQLSEEISKALELLEYRTPTGIQCDVIPVMLDGRNVVVKAPTGSGKTAAFAIPLCEKVCWEENHPQALILEPTRELTDQVSREVFHIGRLKRLKVPAVFGGFPIDKQIQTLRQKAHIVAGTPGRVMDHIRRGSLKLDKVAYLIIDEADLMLDMGFIDDVKDILSQVPEACKISLFSATLKPGIQELADAYIREPVVIMQDAGTEQAEMIHQKLYEVAGEHKYGTFLDVLMQENPESCLIFCGTREMVNVLFQKLRRKRIFCGMLHGEMEQKERLKTVDAFHCGGFRYLIATDVAARGVDFENLTHVINYDFPTGREAYVHRIGRTGRNGKSGTAVTLVCEEDRRMLKAVEEYTGRNLPVQKCPATEEEQEQAFWRAQRSKASAKPRKGSALNEGITRLVIGGGRKSKLRTCEIVAAICGIEGIEASDIGVIDIRDSQSYVEILNGKGRLVSDKLPEKTIKGRTRKVRRAKG